MSQLLRQRVEMLTPAVPAGYSVVYALTNVTSSNTDTTVAIGGSYTTTLTPATYHAITSVTVTMGGIDITATAYANGVVTIAEVTGMIVITAAAEQPPQWVPIEYVQTSGINKIDTGIHPNNTSEYEMGVAFISSGGSATLMCGRNSSGGTSTTKTTFSLSVFVNASGKLALNDYNYDSGWQTGKASLTSTMSVVKVEGRALFVDGVQFVGNGNRATTFNYDNVTYGLLGTKGTGDTWGTANTRALAVKLYYCKMWDNGVLVRDFIPVRVGQIGYLWDKVSQSLFSNNGTNGFTLGPDVNE